MVYFGVFIDFFDDVIKNRSI